MKINTIRTDNFMARGLAELQLPDAGVVVLQGMNGAGKSRFSEAVAYTLWGKTLRGTSPWRSGEAGSVSVETDAFYAARSISAKGTKKFEFDGGKADTNKKTQERADAEVGDFDLWRRSHIFSSSDAAHFSGATDAERKRLIESILSLNVFDEAQAACSQALSDARQSVYKTKVDADWAAQVLARCEAAVKQHGAPPVYEAPTQPERPSVTQLSAEERVNLVDALDEIRQQLVDMSDELNAILDDDIQPSINVAVKAATELEIAKKQLELLEKGQCPTCLSPFDSAHAEHARADYDAKQKYVNDIRDARDTRRRENENRRATLRALRANLFKSEEVARTQLTADDNAIAQLAYWEELKRRVDVENAARRAQWEELCANHAARLRKLVDERDAQFDLWLDKDAELRACEARVDELTEVQKVLGTRGLRAHVLGQALGGIEELTNYWLSFMSPGIRVRLCAYSQTEKGAISERISLEVDGAGGGEGYKAMSGGERRRVDAAILLALAEVAGASQGSGDGTLFMDEVFDALDDAGRAGVAQALAELGKTRCVIVITHHPAFAAEIPAFAHYTVVDGALHARTKGFR